MDSIFLLTIGFIFLGALLSNVLKWRNIDRVLKDLKNFHATIELQDGKKIWGKNHIYPNSMELFFSRSAKNSSGDPIISYILYNDDIDQIRAIFRNHSELSKENQAIRTHEVRQVSNPTFFHLAKRKTRIFFNMFNDAIGEAFNVFLSRMKGASGSNVIATQSTYLKKMGTTALSVTGNAYDPILESYINKRVVVSLQDDQVHREYCGFLKEYSSAWLSVLDCRISHTEEIDLDDLSRLSLQRDMDFSYYLYEEQEGVYALDIVLAYFGVEPLVLLAVKGGDDDKTVSEPMKNYHQAIDKTLQHGESISFTLHDLPSESFVGMKPDLLPLEFEMISEERREDDMTEANEIYQDLLPELKLILASTHIADVYLPRSIAVLRHGSL